MENGNRRDRYQDRMIRCGRWTKVPAAGSADGGNLLAGSRVGSRIFMNALSHTMLTWLQFGDFHVSQADGCESLDETGYR
jgi:hypothetical protein